MGDVIQFVDKIASDATVLLDLNADNSPWQAMLFSAVPPMLRRAVSSSMLVDGDVETASVRGDRTVELSLDLISPNQDTKALELQRLSRIIDGPSALLRYQPRGATHPVYFRTKRGDVAALANVDVQVATSQATLVLSADPYVYGAPVEGTLTVRHDIGVSNPFGFVLTNVLGDAPAPLRLRDSTGGAGAGYVVSSAGSEGLSASGAAVPQPAVVPSGWSTSTETSSAYIGGTTRRFTKASGAATIEPVSSLPSNSLGPLVRIDHTAAGDYRVYARALASASGALLGLKPDLGPANRWNTAAVPTGSAAWVDMGVMRLPSARRAGSPFEDVTAVVFDLDVQVTIPATGWVNLDAVMALPAGLDVGDSTFAASGPNAAGSSTCTLDDQWTIGALGATIPFTGALPQVVPGRTNSIRYFALDQAAGNTRSVTWKYYPRYLSLRPVTS